jgi:putative cell wall-binding protein
MTKDELLRKMEETQAKREADRLASEEKSEKLQDTIQSMATSIETLSQQVKQLLTQASKVPHAQRGFILEFNDYSHLVIDNGMKVDGKHDEIPTARREGL